MIKIHPYDASANALGRNQQLHIEVEFQRVTYDDGSHMLKTERSGRTLILIEGIDERVLPYSIAIQKLMQEEEL